MAAAGDVCLAGTHSGIILIYVAMNLPFVIWILQSFIVQVPRSLGGSGPGRWGRPFPGVLSRGAASDQTGSRGGCDLYLSHRLERIPAGQRRLSDRNTKTVPILIVNNMSEFNVEWGVIMATGMLLAIPPIIFTLFASRQIITGMTAGAVKG